MKAMPAANKHECSAELRDATRTPWERLAKQAGFLMSDEDEIYGAQDVMYLNDRLAAFYDLVMAEKQ